MKKISLVDGTTIRNHQLNTSQSKNGYLFRKSKRFLENNPEYFPNYRRCRMAFYCNGSELSHRKTTFGYGHKTDFTKPSTCSPPATKYMSKSSFEHSKKGTTFGLSRELLPDRSYLIPQLRSVPGPGHYSNEKDRMRNFSYSMRPKLDFNSERKNKRGIPGPGTYQDINLRPETGKFVFSKFKDVSIPQINLNSPRFDKERFSPGPQTYVYDDGLSNKGKYVQSKHKGSGVRSFSHSMKLTFTDQFMKTHQKMPGPGNYERTSDFGIYGDAKYYKTLRQSCK